MNKIYTMFFLILCLLVQFSFASNCQEFAERLERARTFNIYEELLYQSEELLKTCEANKNHSIALSYLLTALETIYQEKVSAEKHLIKNLTDRRIRASLLTLRETSKYKKKYPLLYSYQFLFYVVALENKKAGDYDHALKYAHASTSIGKAILQLK